jgi:hypothetical protein
MPCTCSSPICVGHPLPAHGRPGIISSPWFSGLGEFIVSTAPGLRPPRVSGRGPGDVEGLCPAFGELGRPTQTAPHSGLWCPGHLAVYVSFQGLRAPLNLPLIPLLYVTLKLGIIKLISSHLHPGTLLEKASIDGKHKNGACCKHIARL